MLKPNEFKLTRNGVQYAGEWRDGGADFGIYFRCDEPGSGLTAQSFGPRQITNGTIVRSESGGSWHGPFGLLEITAMFDQKASDIPPWSNIEPLSAVDEAERLFRLEQMGVPQKCWNCRDFVNPGDDRHCEECEILLPVAPSH